MFLAAYCLKANLSTYERNYSSTNYYPRYLANHDDYAIIGSKAEIRCEMPFFGYNFISLNCTGPDGDWEPNSDTELDCFGMKKLSIY